MVFWKRYLFLVSLFALLLGALWLPFRTPLTERYSVLTFGVGDRVYQWAAEGENGLLCAVSRDGANRVPAADRNENGLELRFFNRRGGILADWAAPFSQAALDGELCTLYPADQETAFLAFWQEGGWGIQTLCVYRVERGREPELLLSPTGFGSTSVEQRASIQISSFSRNVDDVYFVLYQADRVISYVCPLHGGGVRKVEEQVRGEGGIATAAPLPDGSLAIGGDGFLIVPGWQSSGVTAGQALSHLTCTSSGIYFVESRTMSVWYSDLSGVSTQKLLSLANIAEGHRITSLDLTPSGEALLLLDGNTLSLVRSGGVTNLTAALYPSRGGSLLAFLFHVLGAGFLAYLLWRGLSILNQNRIPLALYWGTVVLALAVVTGESARASVLLVSGRFVVAKHQSELFGPVVGLTLREDSRGEESLPGGEGTVKPATPSAAFLASRMERLLSDAGASDVRNFHAAVAHRDGDTWILEDGTRAEGNPWFYPLLADAAELTSQPTYIREGTRFFYCRIWDGNVFCASADFTGGLDEALVTDIAEKAVQWCVRLAVFLLVILLLINLDVRRVAGSLERFADNREWVPLRMRSGDELEGMSVTLNALAADRGEEDARRNELVNSYRRFVPEPIINLLGKRSILDVGRESFAVHHMTVMAVSFTFPESVYADQNNARLLFDSVNQVIERTAAIASKKGGTVFNFNYNGYDVILPDMEQAVSAAVAMGQDALALNERRTMDGLPAVKLRMALDAGNVVIGIVGDGTHLEPTTISSRFAAVRKFLPLCEKLDANILCTEIVAGSAEGYGSRYVGKCRVGKDARRLYEIFDADQYGTRTQKSSTLRRFSQAVLSLYSGDTAEAKRTFLELAHETPNDGGARYYLYLADRLAQNPDLPCELDRRVEERREGKWNTP